MVTATALTSAAARAVVAEVPDPEIPVVTIDDLGILRDVRVDAGTVTVTITPTYSGCPAMDVIRDDIRARLHAAGAESVRVDLVLAPAWTTDWMTDRAKSRLAEYGIAPPTGRSTAGPVALSLAVRCPQCGSLETSELSRFGSTSCKSLWRCRACLEPFDHFKVH